MNFRTINEWLEILLKNGMISEYGFKKLIKPHVFILGLKEQSIGADEYSEKSSYIFNDKILTMPFDSIRVMDKNKDEHNCSHVFTFAREQGGILIQHFGEIPGNKNEIFFFQSFLLEEEIINQITINSGVHASASYGIIKPKFVLGKNDFNAISPAIQDDKNKLIEFLELVNCPRHFITKVVPKSEGRSVEWKEQRSHYIILDSNHNKQLLSGSINSFNGTITRSMHNRRGHLRHLTSEKFKNKRGLRIWIKSSWVGPKEWKDKMGNTYLVKEKQNI